MGSECGMANEDWESRFREVYQRALDNYEDAPDSIVPEDIVGEEDVRFLAGIGCSAQELYDFVEDYSTAGEPSLDEVVAVTAIRRDYFLTEQGGKPAAGPWGAAQFPWPGASLGEFRWLPRILAKARAKLRGQLPADLMYGCGGDRNFLRGVGLGAAEFLRMVREAGDDDAKVLEAVKRRVRG